MSEIATQWIKIYPQRLQKKIKKENVMSKRKEFKATHEGRLRILNKVLPCAVLEDGTRIISQSSVFAAFERPVGGTRAELPRFMEANNLQPYIAQGVQEVAKLVEYLDKNNKIKRGYKAEILPALCDIYLQARKDGKLTKVQQKLADVSEIMIRSFAKIGITALVDEATGYQNIRPKTALQTLLDVYINKEFSTWIKRFPDDFYKEIYRLRKWDWNTTLQHDGKRPYYGVIGAWTQDLIYDRLAPAITDEIKFRKGDNKHLRYHQFLTDDVGCPALSQHMHTVIAFMKASDNWDSFKSMLDKALPKKDAQMLLEEAA
jgi:hypothetical protein